MQNIAAASRPRPYLELFRVIEQAGNDKKIDGIILNISSYQAGQQTSWELRNALEKFKSKGKKICAFISSANLDLYSLATVADKIVMDNQGNLMLLGYAWSRLYVQHSLDKLGIGVRELRYMEFKSASEMFTRDSLSDADRRQYGEILDDVIRITRDTVTSARSFSADEFNSIINDEFMFSAKSALARGLVDRNGRKEAVIETIKEISGKAEHFVLYGDPASSLTGSKYSYKLRRAGGWFYRPPVVAVIYANGMTDMEYGIAAWTLASTIREVSRKRQVKAIVLRISSSGGSAEAADYVAEAVKTARERVPVVVSMGSVAASGGYWASMSANHIVASPVTLTGSIGVISTWFYNKGLNDKLGLTLDTIKFGDHADILTGVALPHRDLSELEEARSRDYILDLYSDFTARVAENRGMDLEKVEAIAQGRVYSGIGALNAGLIDSIGGLDDAVNIARNLAKIPDDKKIACREYPKPKFFDRMVNYFLSAGVLSDWRKKYNISASGKAASLIRDFFVPGLPLEDLAYRITRNGQAMPLLPLGSNLDMRYGPDAGE
jgi:protease-4